MSHLQYSFSREDIHYGSFLYPKLYFSSDTKFLNLKTKYRPTKSANYTVNLTKQEKKKKIKKSNCHD